MNLFWKINIYVSIAVFVIFMLYFFVMYFEISLPSFLIDKPAILFFYAPLLEVIQVPLCFLVAMLTVNELSKKYWFYLLMMVVFFILKLLVYIMLLGSVIN